MIQLADAIIPEIIYEEQYEEYEEQYEEYEEHRAYPLSSSRNFQQSLSVSLPPEIILTPSHIINPECDRPPSYESLFPK